MAEQGRSCHTTSSSPEFEFWKLRNFSFSETHLSPADQLFINGILLPLQLISGRTLEREQGSQLRVQEADSYFLPEEAAAAPSALMRKRWTAIFKIAGEKDQGEEGGLKIWSFLRSRSSATGNGTLRRQKKVFQPLRNASSAPCSRSNSGSGRHFSAARRRAGGDRKDGRYCNGSTSVRVLNFNLHMCMGYGSCASFEDDGSVIGKSGDKLAAHGGKCRSGNGTMFNIKSLFSKNVD